MTAGGVIVVIFAIGICVNHGPSTVETSLDFRGIADERPTKKGYHQKQNKYHTPLWVLGHCYPFQGFFKHKRGILGYRIALSTFDNNYLLGNYHQYSIAAYVNMHAAIHVF